MAASALLQGLVLLLALLTFCASARIVPAPLSQQAQLEQIRNDIQQQGSISAATVGERLAIQVDIAFHSGNVTVGYLNATLTDSSLIVLGKASVWNTTVFGTFTFFFATPTSTAVQLQLQFNAAFEFATLYRAVFPATTAPAILGNVKATEQLSVVFSTFAYGSYPAGLTVSSTAVLPGPASANVLTQALATLRSSSASTLTYGTDLYIPLFSANPQDINLKLTEQGAFALTSSIQCSAYQLSVSASSATSFALSVDLAISVQNQAQPVSFSANALWKANTTISFAGSLSGAWDQPFGANWLSITGATVTFDVSIPAKADKLSVFGKAAFSFAPQAQPTSFSATILPSGDFAVSVSGLPVNSIDVLYSAVARTPTPAVVQGIALSGSVNFALASFANGAVAKGFTLSATVTLAPGTTLDKAAKTLAASSQQFAFSLFVPVYSSNVENVDFSLTVAGGFAVTRSLSVTNYRIAVTISQQTTIGLSATAQVALANQPQPLTFNVAANWQENALTTFQGSLQGTWQNPFDLTWLRFVSSVTLSISVATSGPASSTQVSLTGTGILASAPSSPFNFAINVRETGDWLFSVSKFPITTASSFYAAVTGASATPMILNDVSLQGTASLAIATYSSGGVSQGLTLSASATASGSLSKAAATLRVGSTQSYQFALFVPLFGATGSSTVSLSESGAIPLASFLQINSYSVSATLSSAPAIAITAAASVIVPEQSEPIAIQVNAQWNEQSTTTSFVGQLASWQHPMGLRWLSLQGLSVNLVVTSGQVTQFSYGGKAVLSFSSSPVTATVSFDNKGDIVITVANIPINSLDQLYRDVVGVVAPYYLKGLSVLDGSASFTIATASIGGAQKGLSLTAQAQLTDGTLSKAVRTLIASPASLTFGLNLFVPIFDADPAAISLTLTESGSFSLSSNIRFQQFQLSLVEASGQQPSIDLSTQMAITLAQQAQPLVFSVNGRWVADTSVAFAGQLVGQWNQPFGARWLTISAASVSVNVRLAVVQSLAFAGGAIITFDGSSEDVSFAITTSNDFVDTTLVAQTSAKWSLVQVATSMVGNAPAIVTDVNENTASLTLILSTYAHDNVKTGFTVQTKGDITGELLRRVKSLQSKHMSSLQWTVGLNIPLYTSNPVDLSLTLELDDNVPVTKDFAFERLALEVDAAPLSISAETEFQAKFTNNSPLLFNVLGKFSEDGEVTLEGDMIGTWENVFGFQNFDVSDVALEIGFNPAVCVVDGACLSDLGIGFNLSMGTKSVLFDGNVAAPDFEDIFARGAIAGANGMAFTILDVVLEWNRMFPHWPIPTNSVPANWGLTDSSFYFAPRDGTFGGIAYKEGFAFNSGITLLDMDLDLNVSCSKEYADFCDFSFHVDLNWDLFYKMLKREVDFLSASTSIEGDVGEVIVFSLDSVSLTEWSTKRYASGKLPRWLIDITVFDKKHHLDFEVEQWELASSFRSFFHKWLKHIF